MNSKPGIPPSLRAMLCALALLVASGVHPARAQSTSASAGSAEDRVSSPTTTAPGDSLADRDRLTGNWYGWRTALHNHGVDVNVVYTGEIFGNPTGGRKQGVITEGLLNAGFDVDLEKLTGWQGAQFHANAYELHGPSGTNKYVGDFGRFSNIDYYDSIRLYELWLEQNLFAGKISVRLGQMAVDQEFFGSQSDNLFINSDFGVLPTISANIPVPIFATAAPGARLRVQPSEAFFAQAAVYAGNPDPDYLGNPTPGSRQGTTYNRNGIRINLNSKEGAFSIYELDWKRNQGDKATGLPGTYKIGGWYHTTTFSDQRFDSQGRLRAVSGGEARALAGDFGGYLVIDQTLYRPSPIPQSGADKQKDSPDDRGVTGFLRLSGAPGDRNPIGFYLDTGVNVKGLVPGRPKDVAGIAVAMARFSDSVRAADRDRNRVLGLDTPARDEEVVLEGTYLAALAPWLSVQPDAQVIVHPGGSSARPTALVLGLRSTVSF